MGALVVPDIVLFPHCDLHLALSGTRQLTLWVFDRAVTAGGYTLTPIAPGRSRWTSSRALVTNNP